MIDGAARGTLERRDQTILVELTGGLANQLFQWAVGSLLAHEFDARILLDTRIVDRPDGRGDQISSLTDNTDGLVNENAVGRLFWGTVHKLFPRVVVGGFKRLYLAQSRVRRPRMVATYDDAVAALSSGRSIRMRGLFQAADYLFENRSIIGPGLRRSLEGPSSQHIAPYAAVHIRRGDYVSNAKYNAIFGTCSEAYYRTGIGLLDASLPVVLVTDDVPWAKEFAQSIDGIKGRITVSAGTNHFEDLATLAGASQLVLSNSTFSWWGAFLGDSNKTICPVPWFTDSTRDRGLARPEWIPVAR